MSGEGGGGGGGKERYGRKEGPLINDHVPHLTPIDVGPYVRVVQRVMLSVCRPD